MKKAEKKVRKTILSAGLYVFCQVSALLADDSVIDLSAVLSGFGFSVQEVCSADEDRGKCWGKSMTFALSHHQDLCIEGSDHRSQIHQKISSFLADIDHQTLQRNAEPQLVSEAQGLPTHLLNAFLVEAFGMTILTIEVTVEGLVHIVVTQPGDWGYEQYVLFLGNPESLLDADLSVAATIQQQLLTADITLMLTPGHVQPVVMNPVTTPVEEPVRLRLSAQGHPVIKMLTLEQLIAFPKGVALNVRPDMSASYGAARRRPASKDDFRSQREEANKKYAQEHKKQRAIERRWKIAKWTIAASVSLVSLGASYVHREAIMRFARPHWEKREVYYEQSKRKLRQWSVAAKERWHQWSETVSPYIKSGVNRIQLHFRQMDTSSCGTEKKVSITADTQGHYRTTGVIAGQTVNMLIDSGATSVSFSAKIARDLGLHDYQRTGLLTKCETASHKNIDCYRINLPSLRVGCIELFNVEAVVMDSENHQILLGMSFLDRLNWRKTGQQLILQAP